MQRKLCFLIPLVLALLLGAAGDANAEFIHWTGAAGTVWHNASNWGSGTVPGFADDALLDAGTANPAVHTSASTIDRPLMLISVGYSTGSGKFIMEGGTIRIGSGLKGGKKGSGTLSNIMEMSGGEIIMIAEKDTGAPQTYEGLLHVPDAELTGTDTSNTMTLTMTGGLISAGKMFLPSADSRCHGTFNLNGGTLKFHSPTEMVQTTPASVDAGPYIGETGQRNWLTGSVAPDGKLCIAGGTMISMGDNKSLIDRYVDVNNVILSYPALSSSSYHKYIVRDYDSRNSGYTTVTAGYQEIKQSWQPAPFKGDRFAPKTPTLSWEYGENGAADCNQHKVYFGTSYSDVDSASGSAPPGGQYATVYDYTGDSLDPNWSPGTLTLGNQYFWRVDEVYNPTTTKGEVCDFIVTGKAKGPTPSQGAIYEVDSDRSLSISWVPGAYSNTHDIYYGTSATPPHLTGPQGPNSYALSGADRPVMNQTYYWKINEVNSTTVTGDTWSYSTRDYLVVENFEKYTSKALFDAAWPDVSYLALDRAPEGETVLGLRYTGLRGMRIKINALVSASPEAVREFSAAQDWTESGTGGTGVGAKAMSLWIRGTGINQAVANGLYIKLVDNSGSTASAKVYYDGDADIVTSEDWVSWDIDLADFAATDFDLAAVKKICIGVDNTGGGTIYGYMYVDDIRLQRERCVPDKGPAGDITNDCTVNWYDLDPIREEWLESDAIASCDGTLPNSGTWTTGKFGGGLQFTSGSLQFCDVEDLAFPDFYGKTISLWFKLNTVTTSQQGIFCTAKPWRIHARLDYYDADSMRIRFTAGAQTLEPDAHESTTDIDAGVWHHLAIVVGTPSSYNINGTVNVALYLDGDDNYVGWFDLQPYHYGDYLEGICIGARNNGKEIPANITVDDFRIIDAVLNEPNVELLADNDTGTNPAGVTTLLRFNFEDGSGTVVDNTGTLSTVQHPVGWDLSHQKGEDLHSNIHNTENPGSQKVNFKDYADVAAYWMQNTAGYNWP